MGHIKCTALIHCEDIILIKTALMTLSGHIQLVVIVRTNIIEASFGQLVRPHRDTSWPVDKGEQPLLTLLHGRVRHVTEGWSSCWQLRGYSSRSSSCSSSQWYIVSSVPTDKTAVRVMPLVFRHSSVAWFPVTQLQMKTKISVMSCNQ